MGLLKPHYVVRDAITHDYKSDYYKTKQGARNKADRLTAQGMQVYVDNIYVL